MTEPRTRAWVQVVEATIHPSLPSGITRERVIRAIQAQYAEGGRVAGRWLVSVDSLRAYLLRKKPNRGFAAEFAAIGDDALAPSHGDS